MSPKEGMASKRFDRNADLDEVLPLGVFIGVVEIPLEGEAVSGLVPAFREPTPVDGIPSRFILMGLQLETSLGVSAGGHLHLSDLAGDFCLLRHGDAHARPELGLFRNGRIVVVDGQDLGSGESEQVPRARPLEESSEEILE